MERLVLIDGNSLLHRAYHALPKSLTNNAVYGFARMLLKIIKELQPAYLAAAFDRAEPTFRHEVFPQYKEHRPKMDQELVDQLPRVKKLLEGFGVPIYEAAGFEADDVIGTLKTQSSKINEIETTIVTGDRDALQLVDDRTRVYSPRKGLSDPILYNEQKVKDEYGLLPAQIVDYKALRGDPSDGIPGVPGIGEKTATELLQKYENFDNIYDHLTELAPKTAELLKTNREQACLSRKLARINCEAPVILDEEASRVKSLPNPEALAALEKLHFRSLVGEITKTGKSQMKLI